MRIEPTILFLLFVISLAIMPAHGITQPVVGPNINIVPGNDRQRAEPTIAVDPRNPSILVAGSQDLDLQSGCCPPSGHRWNEYYRSTDGGQTWTATLLPGFPGDNSKQGKSSPLRMYNLTSDPVIAFDRNGNVYFAGVADIFSNGTRLVVQSSGFVAKYVNDGADYAGATLISQGKDKPWITTDNSGGPFDGNVYAIFDAGLSGKNFGSIFVRSTDHAKTFSDPILLSDNTEAASGVTVDPSGIIYVAFLGGFGNIPVLKSTDGGLSFSGPTIAANITPIFDPFAGNSFRALTLPQIAADNAGIYIVWDDIGTGQANVLLTRSLDHGLTWSTPLTINNSTIGQHFFPTIAVSAGTISVAWYDSRPEPRHNARLQPRRTVHRRLHPDRSQPRSRASHLDGQQERMRLCRPIYRVFGPRRIHCHHYILATTSRTTTSRSLTASPCPVREESAHGRSSWDLEQFYVLLSL